MKINREIEDKIMRELFESSPSYLDYDDPTIIAFDKNFIGYSAKDLKDRENANKSEAE